MHTFVCCDSVIDTHYSKNAEILKRFVQNRVVCSIKLKLLERLNLWFKRHIIQSKFIHIWKCSIKFYKNLNQVFLYKCVQWLFRFPYRETSGTLPGRKWVFYAEKLFQKLLKISIDMLLSLVSFWYNLIWLGFYNFFNR